jgi:hypothetical protein
MAWGTSLMIVGSEAMARSRGVQTGMLSAASAGRAGAEG